MCEEIDRPGGRYVPESVKKLLPPHPIEFHPDDSNRGRACIYCDFSVPAGCRHIHEEWCEPRR